MTTNRPPDLPFDEELLTGYLDGVLTQQQEQRVRLHLERDAEARRLFEEMRQLRSAALGTRFRLEDDQWDERPRNGLSRVLRFVGLGLLAIWLVALLVLVVWLPEEPPASLLRAVHGAGVVGALLALGSAAIDRLATAGDDIYRRVTR